MRLSNFVAVEKVKLIYFLGKKKKTKNRERERKETKKLPGKAVDLHSLLFHPPGMCEKPEIQAVTEPICMIN